MSINYTDLNKAYQKGYHPLAMIDQQVDTLIEFKIKCFLDAYKGYDEIIIEEKDAEKTTFITERSVYYYKKILFGLKNTKATYQPLVD